MPWLARPRTDDETRRWHLNVLVPRGTVVVAEREADVVGFAEPMSIGATSVLLTRLDQPAHGALDIVVVEHESGRGQDARQDTLSAQNVGGELTEDRPEGDGRGR